MDLNQNLLKVTVIRFVSVTVKKNLSIQINFLMVSKQVRSIQKETYQLLICTYRKRTQKGCLQNKIEANPYYFVYPHFKHVMRIACRQSTSSFLQSYPFLFYRRTTDGIGITIVMCTHLPVCLWVRCISNLDSLTTTTG